MKKIFTLSLLTAMFSASLASACPGGNLLQIIDTDEAGNQMVIANYNISTGERLLMNKSFRIVSMTSGRKSVCTNADCSQLQDMTNKNIKVVIENMAPEGDEDAKSSITIKGISIGGSVPVAKGMPPVMGRRIVEKVEMTKDVLGQAIYKCSKK